MNKENENMNTGTSTAIAANKSYKLFVFNDSDFKLFTNVIDTSKRYWFAEKQLGNNTIEVNGGKYKVHFTIEIVERTEVEGAVRIKQKAKGAYKSLDSLNVDLVNFLSENSL